MTLSCHVATVGVCGVVGSGRYMSVAVRGGTLEWCGHNRRAQKCGI